MAIHSITIQNFKGIGPRVKIDMKPVTLLFGPNSAGKSTILHAIHYAHAVLESSNPDVGRTRLGGDIDLGGFANLVYDHDLDAPVVLGFEYSPDEEDVRERLAWYLHMPEDELMEFAIEKVYLEIQIRWSPLLERPIVERYTVAANRVPLAEIISPLDGATVWLTNVNLQHPALKETLLEDVSEDELLSDEKIGCLSGRKMALPRWDSDLGTDFSSMDETEILIWENIAAAMVTAGILLKQELERFRYVGPLRQAPLRNYLPPKRPEEARWARGLGAWDALVWDQTLRSDVSTWLGNENHLDTGYRIDWYSFRELDIETFHRLQIAAQNYELDEAFLGLTADLPERGRLVIIDERKNLELAPCDLGEGIAQVVPVVAAALARTVVTPSGEEVEAGLVAIEQPELHIHPRMQVVLGDLFLSQATERQFLIETHSEHIMLRLLRRIRETAEKELPADAPEASVDTVAVYYVEPVDGTVKLTELRVSEDGEFLDSWPQGFFDERFGELY